MADSREITLFTQKALLKQNMRHLTKFGLASSSRTTSTGLSSQIQSKYTIVNVKS